MSASLAAGYTDINKDVSPATKTPLDKQADHTRRDVDRIQRLTAQARGFVQSEQWENASVRVELLAD